MRVVAILASHNEEVYVQACIDNYLSQGVEVYLIDNDSTDHTVDIARTYMGRGVIGIERFPRGEEYEWLPILKRKEEIADELRADWYLHADMDEIRRPPAGYGTIPSAIEAAQRDGYTTINFKNFLFMPVQESPDHFHTDFVNSLIWYRYMEPRYPNQVKGWRNPKTLTISDRLRRMFHLSSPAQHPSVNLTESGGHLVSFEGARLSPNDFVMRHYQVLSREHAIRKYVEKTYSFKEVQAGMHGWKATASEANLHLPSASDTRIFTTDDALDASDPITRTLIYINPDQRR